MYWGEIEMYRFMVRDYEKQVRDRAKEMNDYVKEFYEIVKHYNKGNNKMEATLLLSEIRQALDAVKKIRRASITLKYSAVAAKNGVRKMIGRGDWSEVIKEARNLTYFLDEDIQGMRDQMMKAIERVDELKNLLDDMEV